MFKLFVFRNSYSSYYRQLILLGLPIVIGQLGSIVLAFADTLMIGHHSTIELAAAAFVNNMFNLVIIFALGFSYAVTPTVGTLYGRCENEKIGEVVKNAVIANFLLAASLVVVMTVFYACIGLMGQPIELLPYIRPYFLVLLASLPFVCLFNVFKQFADGITDTALSMWIIIGGNLLNILGNWILIYGKFGAPEMGIVGAGLSTLISRIMMAVAMIVVFASAKKYHVYARGYHEGSVNRRDFVHLCKLGAPVALQMGMETAAFSLTSIIVGWIGTSALAAHQVMLTISQLGFMIYYGLGAATAVRISNAVGQRDWEKARGNAYAAMQIVVGIGAVVSLVIFVFRNDLGGLFTDSKEVARLVAVTVIPFVIYQFGDALQIVFGNSLRGLSYVRPLVFYAFIAYFIVSLPLSYLFGIVMNMGLMGVWFSFPFGLTTAGLLYLMAFRKRLREIEQN